MEPLRTITVELTAERHTRCVECPLSYLPVVHSGNFASAKAKAEATLHTHSVKPYPGNNESGW